MCPFKFLLNQGEYRHMWIWHVYLGLPGNLNIPVRRYYRALEWYFVPVMETLVMSEVRAYEVLRDNLEKLSLRTQPLPEKRYNHKALESFQMSSILRSQEWKAFMISPEPRTYRALKRLFGYAVKTQHIRQYPYILKMKIERKMVHP